MAENLDQADFPYVPQGNPTKETFKNTEFKGIFSIYFNVMCSKYKRYSD